MLLYKHTQIYNIYNKIIKCYLLSTFLNNVTGCFTEKIQDIAKLKTGENILKELYIYIYLHK